MHKAFALSSGIDAFQPEPATDSDFQHWAEGLRKQTEIARAVLDRTYANLPEAERALCDTLFENWEQIENRIDRLRSLARGGAAGLIKTRFHGDFHLGQVLMAHNDWVFLDFEGEPTRKLEERRTKNSALKDVAGMLRSFDYAAWAALFKQAEFNDQASERLTGFAVDWERSTTAAFMAGYQDSIQGCAVWPNDETTATTLLEAFTLEKALYEIAYEVANRPDWLRIPLQGVLRLIVPETPEE